MTEWVLIIFIYTVHGVSGITVPGFVSKSECMKASEFGKDVGDQDFYSDYRAACVERKKIFNKIVNSQ